MEQHEETTVQIHRERRKVSSSSESTLFIPLEVALEILSKLPAKSLMRIRCVCKLWSSITTDQYFINSFETWSIRRRPSLVLCIRRRDELFVFLLGQDHQHSNETYSISCQPVDDSYHMTGPNHRSFSTSKSVHGLICCFPEAAKPIIWNPTMRKFLTLTNPEKSWNRVTAFVGYDPIEVKHKVLCMPSGKTIDECRVLTLGSAQESWRRVQTNHNHHPVPLSHECINGVLYYRAYTHQTEYGANIMSFDVRSEKFHMIKLPWSYSSGRGILTTYEGRLACVKSNDEGLAATMWMLKDAEKHGWSPKYFPAPAPYYYERERKKFNLIGISDAGEFVYAPHGICKSFYVLYYDPKRKKFHRVEYKGIANEEFRFKNGLGERRLVNVHVFLNHKETLMSL